MPPVACPLSSVPRRFAGVSYCRSATLGDCAFGLAVVPMAVLKTGHTQPGWKLRRWQPTAPRLALHAVRWLAGNVNRAQPLFFIDVWHRHTVGNVNAAIMVRDGQLPDVDLCGRRYAGWARLARPKAVHLVYFVGVRGADADATLQGQR